MADLETSDRMLVAALRSAGERLATPEVDVTPEVCRRLAGGHARPGVVQPVVVRPLVRRTSPRRLALLAAAVLVVMLATTAVAALLIPGVRVRVEDPVAPRATQGLDAAPDPGDAATPEATQGLDAAADLGLLVTRAEATTALGGTPPWLLAGEVGGRAQLYLHPVSGVVSVAYPASATLPELGESGLGLVLSQFPPPEVTWFEKTLVGTEGAEAVDVAGRPGLWVEGPHDLTFLPDDAAPGRVRQADNVLLWTVEGLTLRMESALDRDAAIDLATSLTRG